VCDTTEQREIPALFEVDVLAHRSIAQYQPFEGLIDPVLHARKGLFISAIGYVLARSYDTDMALLIMLAGVLLTYYTACLWLEHATWPNKLLFGRNARVSRFKVAVMAPFYFYRLLWVFVWDSTYLRSQKQRRRCC
jgi:hypothetical protein